MATLEPEYALFDVITTDADVSPLMGTRMYPGQAPQGAAFPFAVYERANTERHYHTTGNSGLVKAEIDIHVYTLDDMTGLRTLCRHIRDAINGLHPTSLAKTTVTVGSDSITFDECLVSDEFGETINLDDGSGRSLHTNRITCMVGFDE